MPTPDLGPGGTDNPTSGTGIPGGVPSAPGTGTGTMGLPGSWQQYAGPIGAILNFVGQTLGNTTNNQQRGAAIAAIQQGLGWLQSLGIENPQALMQQAFGPMAAYGQAMLDPMAQYQLGLMSAGAGQLGQFQQQMPGLQQPNVDPYMQGPWGQATGNMGGIAQQLMGQAGYTGGQYSNAYDVLSNYMMGNHQGMGTLGEVGGDLMTGRGNTGYNMNAQDAAGRAISGGGYNPQIQGLYDAGNSLFSSGGMTPGLDAISALGVGGIAGNGMSPGLQQAQSAAFQGMGNYGMTPGLQGLQNYGMAQLGQNGGMTQPLQGFSNYASSQLPQIMNPQQTQANQFGPAGNAAITNLLEGGGAAPGLPNGVGPQDYQQFMRQISGMASDPGYTAQNMALGQQGNQGLNNLLARNGQLDTAFNSAQQAFGGGLPGGDPFQASIESIIGQLAGGGFGGGFGGVGGGTATGASAGGLIPMDADLEAMKKQGREYFANNPLLPMDQMISMARDQAATTAAQQAEAAQRFALSRGGGGAVVNAGQQNQAMADFADQAMRAEAQAMRDAALKRQELGLTQQLQGGQIGIGAANADTNRQQVAASRDIASANNATSASIASANNQTQAGVANAQLSMQQAQMRNAALQAAANAAVAARGQNFGQSQAGLSGMLGALQTANQTGSIFNDASKNALTDATQRYAINAGTLNNIPGIMNANANQIQAMGQYQNQYDANRNTANLGVLGGAVGASGQASTANNQAAQILASLGIDANKVGSQNAAQLLQTVLGTNQVGSANLGNYINLLGNTNAQGVNNANNMGNLALGAQGAGTQRMGLGIGAMGQAPGLATNNMTAYGNIGNSASADQLARMLAGSGMVNSQISGQGNFGGLALNALNGGSGAYNNAAGLAGNLYGGQAGQYGSMYGADAQNRNFGNTLNNSFFGNLTGLGGMSNQFTGAAMQPFGSMMNNMSNYSQAALNPYASLMNTYGRMVSPTALNPYAQIPMQQNNGGTNYGAMLGGLAGGVAGGVIGNRLPSGGGGGGNTPYFTFNGYDPSGGMNNGGFGGGGYGGGISTGWPYQGLDPFGRMDMSGGGGGGFGGFNPFDMGGGFGFGFSN